MLDGEAGLGQAMSNGPDWSQVGATLGQDFHITRLTFKNHIGCGHTFAAIDGALELQRLHGIRAGDIDRVHVATYRPALEIACHERPTTANEARFSLTYVVASALAHGSVRLAAYDPARIGRPCHACADEAHQRGAWTPNSMRPSPDSAQHTSRS